MGIDISYMDGTKIYLQTISKYYGVYTTIWSDLFHQILDIDTNKSKNE